ncbi:hypothetical protein L9F63_016960, partial [Diploptera punctata]
NHVYSDEGPAPKRRRGVVSKVTYKRNVVRNARVKGEGCVSYSGMQVAEKAKPSLDSLALNEVKRRTKKKTPEKETGKENVDEDSFKRNHSFKYRLTIGGERKITCKNVFMKIHGIAHNRLERICKLLLQNKTPKNRHGQNRSGNADNFGYSFGRPQFDVCSLCEVLNAKLKDKNLNDNAKRTAVAELMVHKRRAKKFYTSMKEASKDDDDETVAMCFDYMQNLPLPNIPVQEIFYMRQLCFQYTQFENKFI